MNSLRGAYFSEKASFTTDYCQNQVAPARNDKNSTLQRKHATQKVKIVYLVKSLNATVML